AVARSLEAAEEAPALRCRGRGLLLFRSRLCHRLLVLLIGELSEERSLRQLGMALPLTDDWRRLLHGSGLLLDRGGLLLQGSHGGLGIELLSLRSLDGLGSRLRILLDADLDLTVG